MTLLPHPPPPSGLLAWFASNPVAANLLMILILAAGFLTLGQIDKEINPRFTTELITITATYPGAAVEEVEEAVCIPIEEAIHALQGIHRLDTQVEEGQCRLLVWVQLSYDAAELMAALRLRTLAIPNLPAQHIEIEEPVDEEVIVVTLSGPTDMVTLKHLGERIRDGLLNIPDVARAQDRINLPYEISIEVSAERLRQFQMTLQDVAQSVRQSQLNLPGGTLKAPSGELSLQIKGLSPDTQSLALVPLRSNSDGTRLKLGDIATIREGVTEGKLERRLDGLPAISWQIYASHDVMDVARHVRSYVSEEVARLPEGIKLDVWWDNSQAFDQRMETLVIDGITGFILVFVVLAAFLNVRVAFWAGIGILISILGAIWWMPYFNITLNMISLFGLLLVMGILVDDVIIIGESIHARQASGAAPLTAAIEGVREMAMPVVLAALIVAVGFLPGLFLPGWAGELMKPLCVVVILALAFSIIEALLIFPSHLAGPSSGVMSSGPLPRARATLNAGLDRFIAHVYKPYLMRSVQWRYHTLAVSMGVVLIAGALVISGIIPVSFVGDVPSEKFEVELTLPPGAPFAQTRMLANRVEKALFELRDELDLGTPIGAVGSVLHLESTLHENQAIFRVDLPPSAWARINIDDFSDQWRKRIGDLGAGKIEFFYRLAAPPYDMELTLRSADPAVLTAGSEALKQHLTTYRGVHDISDSYELGKSKMHLSAKPEAERLGLRVKDLAEQVRDGYSGVEAVRFLRGREEVKAVVRYPLQERESLESLRAMPVLLPGGGVAPLATLADVRFVPGLISIQRQDRQRVLHVRARVDRQIANADVIYADLASGYLPSLEKHFPNLHAGFGWIKEEQDQLGQSLVRNVLIALVVIYALIAIPFRSYLQPFIFILALPIAWVGSILAHGVLGLSLSIESLLGVVAASGVVVNDSLVLIHYMQRRVGSVPLKDLIAEACAARFRAIFLAFLTSFVGFLPIALETSEQAQFIVPMAVALAFGLLFGMIATLVVVPAAYAVLEDIKQRSRAQERGTTL